MKNENEIKQLIKINNKTMNSELSRIIAGSMIIFCGNKNIANWLSLDSELERLITLALLPKDRNTLKSNYQNSKLNTFSSLQNFKKLRSKTEVKSNDGIIINVIIILN